MSDSIGNKESIIVKHRLKNLYSYSKQSLAPAVSTVGFFFIRKNLLHSFNKNYNLLTKVKVFYSRYHSLLLSGSTLMCITNTNEQYLIFDIWTNHIDDLNSN